MSSTSNRTLSTRDTITGLSTFVLIGAIQALYGPTLPGFTTAFGLESGEAGLVLSVQGAGMILGVLSGLFISGRKIARWRPAISVSLLAIGALLIGLGQSWALTLCGALIIGAGYGGLVIGINTLFASGFGERSPAMVNLLNGIFGIGSILAPLLIPFFVSEPRIPFLILAAICALLIPLTLMLDDRIEAEEQQEQKNGNFGLLLAFIFLLSLGVGLEASTAGFAATYLVETGLTPARAATITSLFFLAFTLSRLVAAPLTLWFSPSQLVLGSLGFTSLLLLLAHNASFAPISIILSGASLAIIFPNGFNWLNQLFGSSAGAIFVIAGALGGGMVMPAILSQSTLRFGESSIVTTLLILSIVTIGFGFFVSRQAAPK